MATLLLADRLYIPTELVRPQRLIDNFERYVFKENMCRNCPVYKKGERFSELCQPCDGFLGFYKTWKETTIENKDYYAVPSGDLEFVEEALKINLLKHSIEDYRSDVKANHPLTFTGQLYDGKQIVNGKPSVNQKKLLRDFYKSKRGVIKAAPRSGKTVCASHITCKYKRKLLYIAHEKQLLLQFYKTLLKMTNLRELRKSTGDKIAGIIENDKDWTEDWDYVLCTYQQFIQKKGFKRLKKHVIGKFGLLICDESHRSSANAYTDFVSKLNMKYKVGMTATIELKSGKEFLARQTLGPVVAESVTAAMTPNVEILFTDFKPKGAFRGRAAYVYANQWLAGHKDRKKLLIKQIFQDLRANPKHSIVIPVMFTNQIDNLVKLINQQGQYNNQNKGESWDENLAIPYYDDKKKQQTERLNAARANKETRVLIGIRKMVKEGIDVPAWTHMYLTFPMNNETDFYQMTQRISTPYEGKPQPILRMVVDPIPLSTGCFVATYHHIKKLKYPISDSSIKVIKDIFDARDNKKALDTNDW